MRYAFLVTILPLTFSLSYHPEMSNTPPGLPAGATRRMLRFGAVVLLIGLVSACSTPKPAPKRSTASSPPAVAAPPATSVTPAVPAARLVWPVQGPVIGKFDGSRNKGIDISGKEGASVVAAQAGRVVYAGSELRGYGNLVIIKHNEQLLTAYAHNRKILVKEDQAVRQGQQIAEMGRSGTDRVKLHFEVRRDGNAVDPMPYLPKP